MPVVNAFVGPLSGSVSDRVGCEAPTAVGLGVYVCGLFAVSTLDEHSSILDDRVLRRVYVVRHVDLPESQ